MQHPLLTLAFLALVSLAVAQEFESEDAQLEWTRRDYPNPMKQVYKCGRYGQQSVICDPNHLIPKQKADKLEQKITLEIVNMTSCPCSVSMCSKDPRGYRISIALMNQIHPDEMEEDVSNELRRRLYAAELFGYTLKDRWSVGRCEEDVLLLYSKQDQVLYTMIGRTAQEKLTKRMAGDISLKYRHYFGSDGNSIAKGLDKIVDDYRKVFTGKYKDESKYDRRNRPQAAALTSDNGAENAALPTQAVSGLLIVTSVLMSKLF